MDRSKADYQALFEENPEPLWVVEPESLRFLEVNRAATLRHGYSREEFLELSLIDLHPFGSLQRLRKALAGADFGSPDLRGVKSVTGTGASVEVDLLVRPVHFEGRNVYLIVPCDSSARSEFEEKLQHVQRMQSLGMLAGGIAHDFNNLLTIISGYSQMLLAGFSKEHPERTTVEQILRASERAADLTKQLLAFSRRQAVQPKVLDLNHIVTGMSPMLHRLIGEHIDLRIEPDQDLGTVHADPGQIEQVIMNLAVNARDAMAAGGRLVVETRNIELGDDYVGKHVAARPGRYIMLAVSDNGTGMDDKTRARVFDPFFTTKGEGKGTGLGLSTVYGIVKQSGGAIDVYSEIGQGTSVKVYLPRIDEAVSPEEPLRRENAPGGWETILLAEDEEAVRRLVHAALEKSGYNLLVADNGAGALRMAKAHKGAIQLLITDVVMPKMSGRELAVRLIKQKPGIDVLYMSGYTDSSLQDAGDMDEVHFLQKPFSPAALIRKVRQILDARLSKNANEAASQ